MSILCNKAAYFTFIEVPVQRANLLSRELNKELKNCRKHALNILPLPNHFSSHFFLEFPQPENV